MKKYYNPVSFLVHKRVTPVTTILSHPQLLMTKYFHVPMTPLLDQINSLEVTYLESKEVMVERSINATSKMLMRTAKGVEKLEGAT